MAKAADLRHRVAFDARAPRDPAVEDTGSDIGAWREQFTVAAGKQYLRGTETVVASRLAGVQPVVLTIRSSAATRCIATDWRARDPRAGESFNIKAVTPDARGEFIDLLCEVEPTDPEADHG